MRKTIKGALELSEVRYTTEFLDSFDLAHLISPDDSTLGNFLIDVQTPLIVSCLYTENDDKARFLDYKIKKDKIERVYLKPKALKLLNNCSLVTVPTEQAKSDLIYLGVSNQIEVVPPGINLARFDFSRTDEKEIFFRHFGEDNERKLVIAIGGINPSREALETVINAAKANPTALFYYLGSYEDTKLQKIIKKLIKSYPKNLKFKGVLTDDLHRSALINADVVLIPGFTQTGVISVYEAMAAKCQIIAREGVAPNDLLVDKVNSYIANESDTLVTLVTDYLNNNLQPTIEYAYEEISKNTLSKFGEDLVKVYKMKIS